MTDDDTSEERFVFTFNDQPHATETASVPFPVLPACPACGNMLRVRSVGEYAGIEPPEAYQSAVGYVEFDCRKGHRFRWRFRDREHDGCSVESVRMLDVPDLRMVQTHVAWTAVREQDMRVSTDSSAGNERP
jgi:hypothetical protein